MTNKTVSIIIPVYNTGKQLENCIESLLKQTYKDLEIILVNDASSDESGAICERFAQEYNEIFKYIAHEINKGQSITRNDGVRVATGNWMMFLDSDDHLTRDAIEKMVEVAEKDASDIVFANYMTYDDNGIEHPYIIGLPEGVYTTPELVSHLDREISFSMLSCIGSKLYNMSFVKNRKMPTPDETITNYDLAFVIDALLAQPKLSYLNKIVYIYYQRAGSISHSYRKNMYRGFVQARKGLMPLLKDCNCYEKLKLKYHLNIYGVISRSLSQEVLYKKGYLHFKEVFTEIRNNPVTSETVKVISSNNQPLHRKVLMRFIKRGESKLAYMLFYLYTYLLNQK